MSTKGRSKFNKYLDSVKEHLDKQPKISNVQLAKLIISLYPNDEIDYNAFRQWIGLNKGGQKVVNKSTSKSNDYSKPKFVLSAWNQETGLMMDIDAYCKHYALPRKDVKSYKLVSHTGTPYYNIVFNEQLDEGFEKDFDSIIDEAVAKHIRPIKTVIKPTNNAQIADRLIYTDVHIGMNVNPDGFGSGVWNKEEAFKRVREMIDLVLSNRKGQTLYIDDLGDFLDGWNGETARGGHGLPQNLDNQGAFDAGLEFKMMLIDGLVAFYDKIIIHNICEDNHAAAFGYVLNSAYEKIIRAKYGTNVEVINQRAFMGHYFIGRHCIVITHGKDSKNLKFGYKPHLDPKQIEKIDQYLKINDIYKDADFIEFSKGDSHQALFDMSGSDDFDYFNYPAFSPSSNWVQTNFKRGRSGFVIQHINKDSENKEIKPFWFSWAE
jgi:hypothetical protein